jgi:hypothetical protein
MKIILFLLILYIAWCVVAEIEHWINTYNPDSLWNRIKYNIRYRYYKYKLEH